MGGGVVGGMVLMAVAGDQTAVPVAVVITVLGVVSVDPAAVAIVRQRPGTVPVRPVTRPAPRKAEDHARHRTNLDAAAAPSSSPPTSPWASSTRAPGGSGGSLLFPFATDAPTSLGLRQPRRDAGAAGLPVMMELAGVAVLTLFLAFFASLGLWVPADMWRPLVLIGVLVCSVVLLVLHPSVYVGSCRWPSMRAWRGSPGPRRGHRRRPDLQRPGPTALSGLGVATTSRLVFSDFEGGAISDSVFWDFISPLRESRGHGRGGDILRGSIDIPLVKQGRIG